MSQAVTEGSGLGTPFRILFVCTGNTCRSPLAEAVARREIERRGWRYVEVGSAGLAALPGSPATVEAVQVGADAGLDLGRHRSRPVSAELLRAADLILAMSPSHLARLDDPEIAGRVHLLGEFASDDPRFAAIPDPFGGPVEGYRETLRRLARLVPAALDRVAPLVSP